MALLLLQHLRFVERRPIRCRRQHPRERSMQEREPATRRCSRRLVLTVTSAAISSAHWAIVRTLWPISSPMSQNTPMSRSTNAVPAGSSQPGQQDQDVDVGVGIQLATAVTTDRHQGDADGARSSRQIEATMRSTSRVCHEANDGYRDAAGMQRGAPGGRP
jgi:hypothetical protein